MNNVTGLSLQKTLQNFSRKRTFEEIQLRLRNLPQGVEILQTGYRRIADKRKPMKLLDLSTMLFKKDEQ